MSTFLTCLDTDLNFWEENPNFKSIREFKNFWKLDKSPKKTRSSRIMWAIALCNDKNIENTWRNEDDADRLPLLAQDVIKEPNFDWESIEDLMYIYQERVLTKPERDLVQFEIKMRERQKFIDKTEYTLDSYDENGKPLKGTAPQLDKMLVDSDKIYKRHEELKAIYEKSEEEGHVRGGREESASESGLI